MIGPPDDLPLALTRRLRSGGARVLQALPDDALDAERAAWLLAEAGDPDLIVLVEAAPYPVLHVLLEVTATPVLLVAEQRVPAAGSRAVRPRGVVPRDADGLTVVQLARAGRRWLAPDSRRPQPLGAERAAAVALARAA